MRPRPRTTLLAGTLLLATAAAAAAHDLFLKLDDYHLPADTPVTLTLLNSTFAVSENSITADRVADASYMVEGRHGSIAMDGWDSEGDSTFVRWRTGEPGTYLLGVSTLPRDLGMSAADFNHYLAHDGVVDVLKERALERTLDQDAWERYAKHVKAVVQVGDRTTGGLDAPFGYPAELVPLDNPYEATVGDALDFRVLVDGVPVPDQLVTAGYEDADGLAEEREARSDASGVVRFEVDAPGRWYIKFIHMAKSADADVDYESKWATLTFEIR